VAGRYVAATGASSVKPKVIVLYFGHLVGGWLGDLEEYTVEQVMCLVHSWELRDAFLDQEC
jgi:hypothetical protein